MERIHRTLSDAMEVRGCCAWPALSHRGGSIAVAPDADVVPRKRRDVTTIDAEYAVVIANATPIKRHARNVRAVAKSASAVACKSALHSQPTEKGGNLR